jgi:hypothetical protein
VEADGVGDAEDVRDRGHGPGVDRETAEVSLDVALPADEVLLRRATGPIRADSSRIGGRGTGGHRRRRYSFGTERTAEDGWQNGGHARAGDREP